MKRRTFLKLSIAGIGALSMACEPSALPTGEKGGAAGEESWVSTVCLQCSSGCGVRARIVEGNVVKLEGNPLHPVNRGRLCPKGQAGLQVLYDPDRIKGPLRRAGDRGAGNWQEISWVEGIETVAAYLRTIRSRGEPHTLAILGGGRSRSHTMDQLLQRFLKAFGSPNNIHNGSLGADGILKAHHLTQGIHGFLGYDLEHTNYLLIFGGSLLEAMRPTGHLLWAYGHMRRGRPDRRAKIVHIDPRFSVTSAKADEWIPINPGSDGALALGMAHVIIQEGLYDRDFVATHAFGFEDWTDQQGERHLGFKSLVLSDYPPSRVSSLTGVPAETIARVAKEFALNRPAISLGGRGASMQSNGIYNYMAIHSLNALIGSLEVPGGVLVQRYPPFKAWDPVPQDDVAHRGLSQPRIDLAGTSRFPLASSVSQVLPESLLSESPYKINALLLYYTNPFFSQPDCNRFCETFWRIPLIVSFSPFMDETTRYADLVLPDCTYLERWEDSRVSGMGYPIVGIRQPVVKPLYSAVNTGDVMIQIARAIEGVVAEAFPWKGFKEMLREGLKGLHQAQRGSIITETFEGFWEELLERGVWWDDRYPFGKWEEVLATPSGKFEFYSQTLKRRLEELGLDEQDDEEMMPHYETPRSVGEEKEYPFILNTYKSMCHAEGRGANQPYLQEIFGLHVNMAWNQWLEINPQTAQALGMADGDLVWVESLLGRFKVRARLYPGAMPHVVNLPYEFGHKAYGRWARGRGMNPNHILFNECEPLAGLVAWSATRVKVYKA